MLKLVDSPKQRRRKKTQITEEEDEEIKVLEPTIPDTTDREEMTFGTFKRYLSYNDGFSTDSLTSQETKNFDQFKTVIVSQSMYREDWFQ